MTELEEQKQLVHELSKSLVVANAKIEEFRELIRWLSTTVLNATKKGLEK